MPREILPVGIDGEGRLTLEEARNRLLAELFSRRGISWWDVFESSDIGRERDLIARGHVRKRSEAIDVGCGRGYFTFARARRAGRVVGVDATNGEPREASRLSPIPAGFVPAEARLGDSPASGLRSVL